MSTAFITTSSSLPLPISSATTSPATLSNNLLSLNLDHQPGSCATLLTLLKAPAPQKETNLRRSFCFPLSGTSPSSPGCNNQDRPRVVTKWKSKEEMRNEVALLDSPMRTEGIGISFNPTERTEPLKLQAIGEEVLLPFEKRETEVDELLAEARNAGLRDRLNAVLGPQTWQTVQLDLLRAERAKIGDRQWVESLRALVEPRDGALWASLSGLLGADGLSLTRDGRSPAKHEWSIQPVKLRRSSARSADSRHRTHGFRHYAHHHHHHSIDSCPSVFGESDQESNMSVSSESPHALMEPIKEDGPELDSPQAIFPDSSSGQDDDDEDSVLGLKILDQPSGDNTQRDASLVGRATSQSVTKDDVPSHGLKYSFGPVNDTGLGYQSITKFP